ncbi:unnamed protein product [Brachionus calyciflorus]|uniref:G-protein coupled receptors family 1 profile domain-containing protein n=1 Tax=Brachionus calyciflorus TaxID=104777 RepID=A0A813Z2T2_9BILA|nr:unnamed protein product [Brachionus calyciflorus]
MFMLNNDSVFNSTIFNLSVIYESSYEPSVLPFFILLILVFIFSLIFNLISITSIFASKQYTPINILITNLGFADITYTFGIPFFLFQLFQYKIPFGSFGCKLFIFTEFSGIIVGILTVAALSVERFIDVAESKNKSKFITYLSSHKLEFSICYSIIVWFISLCFSIPIILSINSECQSKWQDSTLTMFFMLKFLIIFICPYLIIIVSSVKLLSFLNKWKKKLSKRTKIDRPMINVAKNLKESKNNCLLSVEDKKVKTLLCPTGSYSSILETSNMSVSHARLNNQENDHHSHFNDLVQKNFYKKQHRIKGKSDYIGNVRRKATRLVLIILLLFIAQWSPFWIFQIFMLLSSQTTRIENIQFINVAVSSLSYSNTVANPALYMLLTYNFKKNSKKMFKRLFK